MNTEEASMTSMTSMTMALLTLSVSNHFNSAGHRITDFFFKVLEKVYKICPEYLRKREE